MTLGLAIIGIAVVGYIMYKGVISIMDNKKQSTTKKDKNDD